MKNAGRNLAALMVGMVAFSGVARADIKYTQVTSMALGGSGGLKPMSTSTTYTRAGQQRVDTEMQMMGFKQNETTVTTCATHKLVRYDSALKVYTVSPLDEKTPAKAENVASPTPAPTPETAPKKVRKTGKLIVDMSVKKLANETVAGRPTRHFLILSDIQQSGCAGNAKQSVKQEIWMADIAIPVFKCREDAAREAVAARFLPTDNDCDCEVVQKGDMMAVAAAYNGVVMKMKIYEGKTDKVMMLVENTMISQAKLTDADFAIPAGFKELTAKDYDEARQKAMMNAMMGNMGAMMKSHQKDDASSDESSSDDASNKSMSEDSSQNKIDTNSSSDDSSGNDAENAAKDAIKKYLPHF